MKLFVAVLLFALAAASCAGAVPPTNNPGTTFANCSDQAAIEAAQQLLPKVTQALATGDYVNALAGLVTQYGEAEVVCAVQLAVNELQGRFDNTPKTQAPDPLLVTEIANGKAWLVQHPMKT